jgi:glycosyltransferase involved in cell wall biosynthesis
MLAISGLLRFEFTGFFDSTEIDKSRTQWKELIKRIFIGRVKRAFAYGTSSAEYLLRLGIKQERIVRRCQAADTISLEKWLERAEQFRIRSNLDNTVVLGYVGRLAPEKNLFVLLKAFSALEHSKRGHQLIIVGDGPSRGELEQFVGDNGIKGVRFVGSVPPEQVGSWMSQFDVFVLPSSSEPWGLVVNEAMFLGIPTVVSRQCGCCADLIQDGVTGFSFSANDVSELSKIIETLSVNPKLRNDIGLAGKEKIAEFTPRTAALQILDGLCREI